MDGVLLINKDVGISSFGVIQEMQNILMAHPRAFGVDAASVRRRDLPKMGHGGTLDPFATGLLAVCVGKGVKLARYFLGSRKTYEGVIRFGETTVPGDPTAEVSERSDVLPASREAIQEFARSLTLQPYLQTPPMHSAKKLNGKPLYELAREGIEVERVAKELTLYSFEILSYENPHAAFRVECSSGTYVRTLSQDLARLLGTVGMLDKLDRTASGIHRIEKAMTVRELSESCKAGTPLDQLKAWVPFDRLLDGFDRADATPEDALALFQGRQAVLPGILATVRKGDQSMSRIGTPHIAIYQGQQLIAVAREDNGIWGLERVFVPGQGEDERV